MTCRIFLSSPSDVEAERDAVKRVVGRINGEHAGEPAFELVRWEDVYYTADSTFQDQIPRPSDCDLVVCVFWKRLGSDLPERFRRPDGSLPTGTEFEFEDALHTASSSPHKVPDILVYRNMSEVTFSEKTLDFERAQRDRFLAFWNRWFRNEQGHFVAGFQHYRELAEFERLVELHLRQWLGRRTAEVSWTRGSPFRGLAPFDVEHAPIFFGRGRETERVRARLVANAVGGVRFLLVTGASGSGKSSLARAGLLARLTQPGGMGEAAGFARWAAVTPLGLVAGERHWSSGLADALFSQAALGAGLALGDFDTPARLAPLLARGGPEAAAPLARALARMKEADPQIARVAGPAPGALLLLVDQMEELFSWPSGEAEKFLALLEALATSDAPLFALATLRSDFRHRIDAFAPLERLAAVRAPLGPGQHERIIDIAAPGAGDIREMIAGPARAAGLRYETTGERDLAALIEHEAAPDSLPALQFLLAALYEQREGDTLLLGVHDRLGGVAGVMAARGEEVLKAFGPDAETAFPRLARALLAWSGADTPAAARHLPLDALDEASAERRLALALRDASLLTSGESGLRIAHESLVEGWERLRAFFHDERRLFEVRERLTGLCRRHAEIPEADAAARARRLLQGFPLEEGRDLLAKWGRETLAATEPGLPAFIAASDARDRARRRGILATVAATALLVAAVIGTAAWFRVQSVADNRRAEVRLLLARSEAALRERDWDAAAMAAGAAWSLEDGPETRSMAATALSEYSPNIEDILETDASSAAWLSPASLALLTPTGTLVLREDGKIADRALDRPAEGTAYVGLWPAGDGGLLALGTDSGLLRIAAGALASPQTPVAAQTAAATGHLVWRPHQADARAVDDGVRVAVTDIFSGAMLRDCVLTPAFECRDTAMSGPSPAVALSPDASRLALVHADGATPLLDVMMLADGAPVSAGTLDLSGLGRLDAFLSIGWSHDGRFLAVGTQDGRVALADLSGAAPRLAGELAAGGPVASLAWSPVSAVLAYACADGAVCRAAVDETGAAHAVGSLDGSADAAARLAWSPDGDRLASVHVGGEARLWRNRPAEAVLERLSAATDTPLTSLAVDREREIVAAGDEGGRVWLWTADGTATRIDPVPEARGQPVVHLAFGGDGALGVAQADGFVTIRHGEAFAPLRVERLGGVIQRLAWTGALLAVSNATEQIALIARTGAIRRLQPASRDGFPVADGLAGTADGAFIYTSHVDGSIRRWAVSDGAVDVVLSAEAAMDDRSALSLSLDPSQRWLAATRTDEQVRLYDLSGNAEPVALPVFARDTKVVAFSPDGRRFAALGSDARLYVWSFDAQNGRHALLASLPAVPEAVRGGRLSRDDERRAANWIDWRDSRRIAIATAAGEALLLDIDPAAWRRRLGEIAQYRDRP